MSISINGEMPILSVAIHAANHSGVRMKLIQWLASALAALAAMLLPACDVANLPAIKPGITTAAEVRERLGEPGARHANPDGSVTWEYDRQPSGIHCYMITIGSNEIVQAMEQVLNEQNYARARVGMTRDDIRRLYGRPGSIARFDNLGEEIWEWRIEGMPPTEETYFMAHFDLASGLLKTTSKRVAPRG